MQFSVAQELPLTKEHQHKYDSLLFADSVIVSNVISFNNTSWPKLHAQKMGIHQLDFRYKYRRDNWFAGNYVDLYQASDPIQLDTNFALNIKYSYGLGNDHLLSIKHRQKIGNAMAFFDFSRVFGESNFNHSENSVRNFRIGMVDTVGRLNYNIQYINSAADIQENGGIDNLEELETESDVSSLRLFTNLNTANNLIDNEVFQSTFYYSFNQRDSIQNSKNKIKWSLGVNYLKEGYQFNMQKRDIDSLYFEKVLLDSTLTRDSVGNAGYSPHIGIKFEGKHWHTHVSYERNFYQNEVLNEEKILWKNTYSNNNVSFNSNLDYRLSGIWAQGYLFAAQYTKDSLLNTVLNVDVKHANIKPQYFYQNYFGNHFRWNNNFNNERNLELDLMLTPYKFPVKPSLYLYAAQNHTYLNASGISTQASGGIFLLRGDIEHKYHNKFFISVNKIGVQVKNSDILRVPLYYLKTSQALNFKILGMPLTAGASVIYTPKHDGLKFNPNLRHYQLQNEQQVGGFPYLDVFIGAKAGGADLYVKMQNLSFLLLDRSEMLVYEDMIIVPNFLRFGFSWKFID